MSINKETAKRETIAHKRATVALGAIPDTFSSPLTVLASPAWRGIEGDIWRASTQDKSIILKHYHCDTHFYVDTAAAIEAATNAGKSNLAPAVIDSWVDDGIVVFADLGESWRAGGLHDAINTEVRSNVIESKKTFQRGNRLSKSISIFDEIENYLEIITNEAIFTHNDISVFAEYFSDAKSKITSLGFDTQPCHRDGNTANIMVGPDNSIQLIDFDLAANCDPFEDVGCHLAEYFESDAEARTGFEEWHGHFNEGLFQRSMIYGLADDMRWGLISAILAAKSPRRSLEFGKYSAWRLLRLEIQIKKSQAFDRIRKAT